MWLGRMLVSDCQIVGTDNVPWRYLWQGLGVPSVRILYRWSSRYALEGVLEGVRCAVVLAVLSGRVPFRERTAKQSSLHGVYLQEEQSSGRKIPADLEVFGEKEYFYKKKDAL